MPDVIDAAREARENAYAPYSGYRVGAAVLDTQGRVWSGCNVENVSYPLGMCAERNAVFAMIRGGGSNISQIAVVTRDGATPCGGCLQVLLEFALDPTQVNVHTVPESGAAATYTLAELIPHGFRSSLAPRTER
ncbi:MAG TPA: cytidine deaminase [Fimbriimonadaceae bacterium]|nr:cytidine deaminase [Fimbriimonadaceae bacterium]